MKKIIKLLFWVAPLLLSGCFSDANPEVENPTAGSVKLSEVELEFEGLPSTYSVEVESTSAWSAQASADWITITKSSGNAGVETLEFEVSLNEEDTSRNGVISITTDDPNVSATLTINQGAKPANIYLYEESFSFEADEYDTTIVVNIYSPSAWSAQTSADWISITKSSGDAGIGTLEFSVSSNEKGAASRKDDILIATDDQNVSAKLTINQEKLRVRLEADKTTIYNDGEDKVTFTVFLGSKDVTNDPNTCIFDGENQIDGNTFKSAEEPCTHKFSAMYGAMETESYMYVYVVKAPPTAPEVPTDNNPTKTNFKRRVLLTQFTGTGCQFCPYMVNALYEMNNNKHYQTKEYLYRDKIVIAAAHIGDYAGNDPARLENDLTLDDAFGISSFPSLIVDMVKGSVNSNYASVKGAVDNAFKRTTTKGGIAVNAQYHSEEKFIVINTLVKAAETAEFRVGAWLLEDGIYGVQTMNSGVPKNPDIDYNNHDNCIRSANSKHSYMDYTGFNLGTITAGKTASREFSFPLKSAWNVENLRLIVFITTKEGNNWYVNNVVHAPINGSVDFEYTK